MVVYCWIDEFFEEGVNLHTTHLCQLRPIPEYSVLPCTSGPSSKPKSELKTNNIFPTNGFPGSTGNTEDIADDMPSSGHPLGLSFPLDGVDSTSFDILHSVHKIGRSMLPSKSFRDKFVQIAKMGIATSTHIYILWFKVLEKYFWHALLFIFFEISL